MKKRLLSIITASVVLSLSAAAQVGVNFEFSNAAVTPSGLEFDVLVSATADGDEALGTTLILINYPSAAFGSNIASSVTVQVYGAPDGLAPNNFPCCTFTPYDNLTVADNQPQKLAITVVYSTSTPGAGTDIDTTPQQLVHVLLPIDDRAEMSGLSFDAVNMDGQVIQDDNATAFSTVNATNDLNIPLPIELVSFKAVSGDEHIDLNWETATEIDNSGFEVQRSVDGIDFEEIGFVEGRGTTVQPQSYRFSDRQVPANTNKLYYRLRQIDFDGSSDFSSVVEVGAPVPSRFSLKPAYPNPFNGRTVLSYDLASPSKVALNVYDALGRLVKSLVNEEQDAGRFAIPFNANGLPSGVYIYRIQAGNFVDSGRVLYVK